MALDAQVGDIASLLVVVTLAGTSLVLARRGSWWATAIPAAVFAFGAWAYVANDEPEPAGGTDIEQALGAVLMCIGAAWFVVAVAITLLARRLS